jgi:hypothetical protein
MFVISLVGLAIAGIISAGGIWALLKNRVVVDEKGEVVGTEVEIPFVGRLKTGAPSIAAVFIGAALCFWIVDKQIAEMPQKPLQAEILLPDVSQAGALIVGAVPQRYMTLANNVGADGRARIEIPVDEPDTYQVIAFKVAGVGVDGLTAYRLTHGPAQVDVERGSFFFDGQLR